MSDPPPSICVTPPPHADNNLPTPSIVVSPPPDAAPSRKRISATRRREMAFLDWEEKAVSSLKVADDAFYMRDFARVREICVDLLRGLCKRTGQVPKVVEAKGEGEGEGQRQDGDDCPENRIEIETLPPLGHIFARRHEHFGNAFHEACCNVLHRSLHLLVQVLVEQGEAERAFVLLERVYAKSASCPPSILWLWLRLHTSCNKLPECRDVLERFLSAPPPHPPDQPPHHHQSQQPSSLPPRVAHAPPAHNTDPVQPAHAAVEMDDVLAEYVAAVLVPLRDLELAKTRLPQPSHPARKDLERLVEAAEHAPPPPPGRPPTLSQQSLSAFRLAPNKDGSLARPPPASPPAVDWRAVVSGLFTKRALGALGVVLSVLFAWRVKKGGLVADLSRSLQRLLRIGMQRA